MYKKKKPEEKLKRGPKFATKYDPDKYPILIKWMRRYGLSNRQICKELKISTSTLHNWMETYPEVKKAMDENKRESDNKVADSLLQRAIGYNYSEIKTKEIKLRTKNPAGEQFRLPAIQVETTIKHVPADVLAAQYWLNNRYKEMWSHVNKHEFTGRDGKPIEHDIKSKTQVNFYIPSNGRKDKSLAGKNNPPAEPDYNPEEVEEIEEDFEAEEE
jgi:hypothetical protein